MLCFFTRTWLACWDIKIFQFCKRSIKQKISKRDIKKARQKNISILQTLHIAATNKTGKKKPKDINQYFGDKSRVAGC